jgi:hypothetical protein
MLLDKINNNWSKIEEIGADAEERGRKLGVEQKPSWSVTQVDDDTDKVAVSPKIATPSRLRNKVGMQ